MKFCFIVEHRYADDGMPLMVADQLERGGHDVVVLSPHAVVTEVTALAGLGFDAFVLKTVSGGPGLSILDAASAAGCVTVNRTQAIRLVRDKAVAAVVARRHGLPFPDTWFAADTAVFYGMDRLPFPLVIKPNNGSSGEQVFVARTRDDLVNVPPSGGRHWLAQRYLPNPGVDLKIYNTGEGVYAELRTSPLEPSSARIDRLVRVPPELHALTRKVGAVFGLDIYGIDLVQGPTGWAIVDINDFPSFRLVPDGPARVADTVLAVARRRRRAALEMS